MILSFHLGPYAIKLLYCSLFYDQNVLNVCLVSCPVYCLVSSFRNREEPWQERGDFIVNKMTGLTLLVVWVDWSLVRTVWSGHKVSRQPGWAKSFYSVQLVSIHLELLISWNARYFLVSNWRDISTFNVNHTSFSRVLVSFYILSWVQFWLRTVILPANTAVIRFLKIMSSLRKNYVKKMTSR